MQTQHGNWQQLRSDLPSAVCIGSFDGLHRGHLALLDATLQQAQQHQLISSVLSFDPPPKAFFKSTPYLAQLSCSYEKQTLLAQHGIQQWFCMQFNQALAKLSAEDFIKKILCQQLQAQSIIVGKDFRFGQQRQGDVMYLKKLQQQYAYRVIVVDDILHQGRRISSSWLRQALDAGELELAHQLLGRSYSMSGIVQRGDQRGRQIGFRTANIDIARKAPPLRGVFIVQAEYTLQCDRHATTQHSSYGVANLGYRPSVEGTHALLEVHLFADEKVIGEQLYDRPMQVNFLHKLRDEQKFASLEDLTAHIQRDVQQAKQWLELN